MYVYIFLKRIEREMIKGEQEKKRKDETMLHK
jgi:hypothetical protein